MLIIADTLIFTTLHTTFVFHIVVCRSMQTCNGESVNIVPNLFLCCVCFVIIWYVCVTIVFSLSLMYIINKTKTKQIGTGTYTSLN